MSGQIGDTGFRAETFEEHMHPAIHWIGNPEFDKEFDRMLALQQEKTKGTPMAAHTNVADPVTGETSYPAFINIRFENRKAIVTMRGDPQPVKMDEDAPVVYTAGKQTEATFDQHDWDQFISEATRERGLVPGG